MAALFVHTSDTYPPGEQRWTTGLKLQAQLSAALIASLRAPWWRELTPSTYQLPHFPSDFSFLSVKVPNLFFNSSPTPLPTSQYINPLPLLLPSPASSVACTSPSAARIPPPLPFTPSSWRFALHSLRFSFSHAHLYYQVSLFLFSSFHLPFLVLSLAQSSWECLWGPWALVLTDVCTGQQYSWVMCRSFILWTGM